MPYSIKQILSNAADKLNKLGINNPGLDARVLLQHILDKPYEYLLINHYKQLNQLEIEAFEKALARRLNQEPIAYIIGVKEFYSREFIVNNHVLIPRADTELLVDVALSLLKKPSLREETVSFDEAIQLKNSDLQNFFITSSGFSRRFAPRNDDSGIHRPIHSRNDEYTEILELGTGSGCIAISLLLELPNSTVTATDISLDAIEVAKSNASKHQVTDRLDIIQSNWFENIGNKKFDLIVSNPPYIAETEKPEMAIETINYEPQLALFAEEDGLEAYKIIAAN
ncbi:MAG: HemK family protein methyltransferase, partial [Rickettsia endosymbiont of Pentastiridius leporinus]